MGWIASLGTTDLACPYCGAGGDRPRAKTFKCRGCGRTVRPRNREGEYGARYYTQADWFLVDALRRGELTPDIIAAAMAGQPPEYAPHSDPAVMRRCEEAVEVVAAEIGDGAPTAELILIGFFKTRCSDAEGRVSFRSAFELFRYAEFLWAVERKEDAVEKASAAIYLSAANPHDPIVPPAWLGCLETWLGRNLVRRDLDRVARTHGYEGATDDVWATVQGRGPVGRARVDHLAALDGGPPVKIGCGSCGAAAHNVDAGRPRDRVSCQKCGAWLGTRSVLIDQRAKLIDALAGQAASDARRLSAE